MYDIQLFHIFLQIRIDALVDKWSGSLEVGITSHNPNLLDFPNTMTNMRSGELWPNSLVCEFGIVLHVGPLGDRLHGGGLAL